MPATYEPIATTTLGSAASTITFSSIPATYTDLRIVVMVKPAASFTPQIRVNSLGASSYGNTRLYGDGATATSAGGTNNDQIRCLATGTQPNLFTFDIFSYAGSTYKTILTTQNSDQNGSGYVYYQVSSVLTTSAMTSFLFADPNGLSNLAAGTTATLFGILKA